MTPFKGQKVKVTRLIKSAGKSAISSEWEGLAALMRIWKIRIWLTSVHSQPWYVSTLWMYLCCCCCSRYYDEMEATNATYNPAFGPSARSLLHEVEEALTQNDRIAVYLRDVGNEFRVQRAGQRAASWRPSLLQIGQTGCRAVRHDTQVVARETPAWSVHGRNLSQQHNYHHYHLHHPHLIVSVPCQPGKLEPECQTIVDFNGAEDAGSGYS